MFQEVVMTLMVVEYEGKAWVVMMVVLEFVVVSLQILTVGEV